ncbi:oligosaccharide flippase family protein [Massilia forsythiae]|uniref:Oligosaccharide flippase family protein n=1 Tax=Massilia forsythiae TaxID=2728020 RepID=A0A7Z2ZSV2_9BURK|nr:oligosaccharide flippase family protein [Massilia forsythiae]QJE00896.1 oligosaccharide flippase family protein [Massilia forsythiae]
MRKNGGIRLVGAPYKLLRSKKKENMNTVKSTFSMGAALLCKLLTGLIAVKICAYYLGVQKFGLSGQISSLISIVTLLAGGGVATGLTKIYAAPEIHQEERQQWIKAAHILAACTAVLLLLVFLFFKKEIENRVLDESPYSSIIFFSVIASIAPISLSAVAQGIINGNQKTGMYSRSLLLGSIIGIFGFLILSFLFGARGSLCGLVWIQIAQALSFCLTARAVKERAYASYFPILEFSRKVRFLLSFGLLSIVAGATIPLVYMYVRSLIIVHQGSSDLGIWQATVRLSEAYTQLPMLMLSVVFFPRFSSQAAQPLQWRQVWKAYGFILALMGLIGIFVSTTRNTLVHLLFTPEFQTVSDFVFWQISGDTFRMLSYVGTMILAARGLVKLCILAEFLQAALFGGISTGFIANNIHAAPFASYLLTYVIYFLLTVFAVLYFCRQERYSNAPIDR